MICPFCNKFFRPKIKPLRQEIIVREDNRCADCHKIGTDDLIIHHIDGIKYNNIMENLILVCKLCHAIRHKQTKTFLKEKIFKMRKNNKTFKEIGKTLGLSKQRVHQIFSTPS